MFNKDLIINLISEKGWSRYKLCKQANLAQSTLSDILSGKNSNPRMDTIQKIADALGVSVNDFFDDDSESKENIKTNHENEEFDEEIRAIARNMKKLSTDKRKLLSDLVKTMSEAADEALRK